MSRRSRCARGTLGLGCRSDSRGHPQIVEYLNASLSGLIQVFGWPAFGLMLIGIGLGFVVGILPGLGGPTTLAIMLPFVFKMNPVEAFAFLLGMAAVTNTTGDITSILFGIPGEPTTASTIVDGHPMAKHGEAGRALGAAIMSSLFGAVFGALVLALAIPVVRPLVLTFGSPEFFMLALLGITFVASLSGEAILKGLVAGCFGLWLATIRAWARRRRNGSRTPTPCRARRTGAASVRAGSRACSAPGPPTTPRSAAASSRPSRSASPPA